MIAWLFIGIGTLITFERSTPVLSFIPSTSIIRDVNGQERGLNNYFHTPVFLSPIAHIAVWFLSRFTLGVTTTARFASLRIALN
jgi:hypothetical protein